MSGTVINLNGHAVEIFEAEQKYNFDRTLADQ